MSKELRMNWEAISWQTFQDLCCRLLHRVYGYDIRPSKTMGADGGVDALIAVDEGKKKRIAVQCKHWTTHMTLSRFNRELDKEISKISKKDGKLDFYIFMTSYELTKEMKEYFEKVIDGCEFGGDCIDAPVLEIWLNENQDIREEVFGACLLRHNWGSLISVCGEQTQRKLNAVRESGKYIPELYVDRGMERNINQFLLGNKLCFLVIGKAGSGKTNLACHMAEEHISGRGSDWPCILLLGGNVIIEDERSLVRRLLMELSYDENVNAEVAGRNLEKILSGKERGLVIYIDGINENANIRGINKSLRYLMEFVRGKRMKLCVSCRDIFWDYFRDCFLESEVYLYNKSNLDVKHAFYVAERVAAKGILGLDDFSDEEYESALMRYFAHFSITGSINGRAKEKCSHPLLLRFFCEAYEGQDIGKKQDLHLLDLFELYWKRKLENLRVNLGLRTDYNLSEFLISLSELLRKKKTNAVPVSVVIKEMGADVDSSESVYTRILDEHIILEEDILKPQRTRIVKFVYDEFFEYVMARGLWDELELGTIDKDELREEIRRLAVEAADFPHYKGLIQYLLLMLGRREAKLFKEIIGYLSERLESTMWVETVAALLDGVEILDDEIKDILVKWTRAMSKEMVSIIGPAGSPSRYEKWKISDVSCVAKDVEYEIRTVRNRRTGKLKLKSARSIDKIAMAVKALISYRNSSSIRRFGFNELLLIGNSQPELAKRIVDRLGKDFGRRWTIRSDKFMDLVGSMYLQEKQGEKVHLRFGEELKVHSQENYMINYVERILTTDRMAHRGICSEESVEGLLETMRVVEIFREILGGALGSLTARETYVLIHRFGLGLSGAETLEVLGRSLNISRERIRQIEAKALRKLRHPSRSRNMKHFINLLSKTAFCLPEYDIVRAVFGEPIGERKAVSLRI